MFDLDKAIAFWGSGLEHRRALSEDDLDELEQHLRDHIAALVKGGRPVRAAFREALGAMGDYASAEAEYKKVQWGKLRRQRGIRNELAWRFAMLKNYLKVTLRNLWRHKSYTAINVLGLAVGLACCLLIGLYVYHEWSYDRFHENAERIHRLVKEVQADTEIEIARVPGPAAPALKQDFPEVEEAVRLVPRTRTVRYEEEDFFDQRVAYADSGFFDVFSFDLFRGDPRTALAAPFTVVLTESAAERYFGNEDPVGQTLPMFHGSWPEPYTVTGIVWDAPSNSHLHFDALASFTTEEAVMMQAGSWSFNGFLTYVLLKEGADPDQFEAKLGAFFDRYVGAETSVSRTYFLQPLSRIHLHSDMLGEAEPGGSAGVVYLLAVVALLTLLIAGTNYINLSTARSSERIKEVGVRKVLGAQRGALAARFVTEAVMLSVLALALALLMAALAMPSLSALTGTSSALGAVLSAPGAFGLVAVAVVVGVLAGAYPAFALSLDLAPFER